MRQASFATVAAIRMQASMNLKCIPLLAMALLLPTASPVAAETIDIAIGHQTMCTDTYTGGIVIKELKLLEKHLPRTGKYADATYNIYWAEKYQGLLVKDTTRKGADNFTNSANKTMAANLRGHLLLFHGDMDDNVPPALTIQVIDALSRANKDYDLMIVPNGSHAMAANPYFRRRRWDYFVTNLMGEKPPVGYEIKTKPEYDF